MSLDYLNALIKIVKNLLAIENIKDIKFNHDDNVVTSIQIFLRQ